MDINVVLRLIFTLAIYAVVADRGYAAFVKKTSGPVGWRKWLLAVAFAGVLWLGWRQETYLPFLGPAAVPTGALLVSTPDRADASVIVSVSPKASHVVFWGAESSAAVQPNPRAAYGNLTNAGCVAAVSGAATLRFRTPARYRVGVWGRTLPRHVHFREVLAGGMLGRVQTVRV